MRIKKIILIVLILIVICVVIWAIWVWQGRQKAPVAAPAASSAIPGASAPAVSSGGAAGAAAVSASVEAIARSFAERFGSYSNQSNFENVTDLYPFMTDKMKNWAEKFIIEAKAQNNGSQSYFGLTTKALGSKILEQDKNSMAIRVMTSRRESNEKELSARVYSQDLELTLIKDNDLWKVDGAGWK